MSQRPRKAALEIQLLLEEYTSEELAEALVLIGGHKDEDLLSFLARSSEPGEVRPRSERKDSARSVAVVLEELKTTDPEKHRILSDFEARLRREEVLPTLDDVRVFGKRLKKDYKPAKSRRAASHQLITLLAAMELATLQAAIAKVPLERERSEGAYGRLAEHLISGAQMRKS